MLDIPELSDADIAFGSINHLPKRESLPDDFQSNWSSDRQPFCRAMRMWFYQGATSTSNGIVIDGVTFKAKPGVDAKKALRAIKAALGSYEPQHEHKIGACGFLLSEWFDMEQPKANGHV